MLRKGFLSLWLLSLFSAVISLFWYNDWIYQLPTPVPDNYTSVPIGRTISFHGLSDYEKDKPVFIHFFNPDCPCSRFNVKHFQSLVRRYGQDVNFVVVVMSKKDYSVRDIQDRFGITLPVLFDSKLAESCGVYSTPQAVIINGDRQLFYRGNYNKSRYCTNKQTDYARIALDSLLNKKNITGFDHYALQAYGCQLPGTKVESHE